MAHDLFLFDLDDTLLDFRASERLSFFSALAHLGADTPTEEIFADYQAINHTLWAAFERNEMSKDALKVERWRMLFAKHPMDIEPERASTEYLNTLPQTVVLVDHAVEICEHLSSKGEIGIITNGIQTVQRQRIANSAIAPFISFVSVSEACGFAKPDTRFFEYSTKMAKKFAKASTIIIGDRIEADILGAQNFGIDGCWFNPARMTRPEHIIPTYEIQHLSELRQILAA